MAFPFIKQKEFLMEERTPFYYTNRLPYDVIKIADAILSYAEYKKLSMNTDRLQMLLYLAEIVCYGNTNQPLFAEPIEAWSIGPIVRNVYYYYDDDGHPFKATTKWQDFELDPLTRNMIEDTIEMMKYKSTQKLKRICKSQPPYANTWTEKKTKAIILQKELAKWADTLYFQN